MRIAIVNETWGAGAARCARDLESALRCEHDVLSFPRTPEETTSSTFEGLASFEPDVVHCHSFYGGLPYGSLWKISRAFPVCYTVHDPRPIGTMETICWTCDHNNWCLACPLIRNKWRKRIWNRFFVQRLQKRLCHWRCQSGMKVVAPSEWMAGRLRERELRRFQIVTIPNGVDLERFRPLPSARARFGLPEEGIVLLHAAFHTGSWAINERKGLQVLADAFVNFVKPRFPSAVLAVAGERVVPNHPGVLPLGMVSQDDLASLLCSADVFVSATLADNCPYTVLEAMSCGRAVVASRVGGVPEQVADGETGLLVRPGDPTQLGETLVDLLSKPDRITQLGTAGRLRARRLFGMEQFTNAYRKLLEELASHRKC